MKRYLILAAAVAAALLLIPAAVCSSAKKNGLPVNGNAADASVTAEENETIAVFMPKENKSETMKMRDYIIGCLAAEMPAEYEHEALCAQALACVTLARYMTENNKDRDELKGAVITADSKKNQGYMTVEEMRSRWGDDFEKYYDKLCAAADEVLNYTVTYNGKPAMTAFHAISAGVTEDAVNVWDKSIPYLVSVDSSFDKDSPKYLSASVFTQEELTEKLGVKKPSGEEARWLSAESYTKAGTLRSIKIADKTFTGEELRSLLGLRSAAITVAEKDGGFVFETKGYGHGVGMSQNGANCLAKEGCTWREIIEHYYPGTEIK